MPLPASGPDDRRAQHRAPQRLGGLVVHEHIPTTTAIPAGTWEGSCWIRRELSTGGEISSWPAHWDCRCCCPAAALSRSSGRSARRARRSGGWRAVCRRFRTSRYTGRLRSARVPWLAIAVPERRWGDPLPGDLLEDESVTLPYAGDEDDEVLARRVEDVAGLTVRLVGRAGKAEAGGGRGGGRDDGGGRSVDGPARPVPGRLDVGPGLCLALRQDGGDGRGGADDVAHLPA